MCLYPDGRQLVSLRCPARRCAGTSDLRTDPATLDRATTLDDFRVAGTRIAANFAQKVFEDGRFPGWIDSLVEGVC